MYLTMLLNTKSEFEDWKIEPLQPGVLDPAYIYIYIHATRGSCSPHPWYNIFISARYFLHTWQMKPSHQGSISNTIHMATTTRWPHWLTLDKKSTRYQSTAWNDLSSLSWSSLKIVELDGCARSSLKIVEFRVEGRSLLLHLDI